LNRTVPTLLAACLIALTGCGNDPSPAPVDPTTTATSAPTQAGPVEPTLPPAASAQTKAGAIAFAKYYWDVANYAMATLDINALRQLQDRDCGQCRGAIEWMQEVSAAGGHIIGGASHIVRLNASAFPGAKDRWLVELQIREDSGRVVDAGRLNKSYAQGRSTDVMILRQVASGWKVASWKSH
jgi:hypothetical protein